MYKMIFKITTFTDSQSFVVAQDMGTAVNLYLKSEKISEDDKAIYKIESIGGFNIEEEG